MSGISHAVAALSIACVRLVNELSKLMNASRMLRVPLYAHPAFAETPA
jgi:hypothetical protein